MNAVFHFAVHHLRWLMGVPFFPQIFDSLLLVWTCVTRRSRLAAMMRLEAELGQRVRLAVHRYGGMEFRDETGRELGHLHGHGLLDARPGRERARKFIKEGRVRAHHIFPHSGWVSFQMETPVDVPFALSLLGGEDG